MRKRTFLILLASVCFVVVAAEAYLLVKFLGKKHPSKEQPTASAEGEKDRTNGKTEQAKGKYPVWRVVEYTSESRDLSYVYDNAGRVLSMTLYQKIVLPGDPYTEIVTYLYDEQGNLTGVHTVHQEEGGDTPYEYDYPQSMITGFTTDYEGGVSTGISTGMIAILSSSGVYIGSDFEIRKEYDQQGRLILSANEQRTRRFEYDNTGNMIRRIDIDNSTNKEIRHCIFTYDNEGRPTSARSSYSPYDETAYVELTYDKRGNPTTIKNCRSDGSVVSVITNEYDDNNHRVAQWTETGGQRNKTLSREYKLFYVEERYLTDEERRDLGLPFVEENVLSPAPVINPYSWQLRSDYLIIY